MGGFCGGGGPERGTPNSTTSGSRDYNSTRTVTSSPRPRSRPDTSSTSYKVKKAVTTAASNLARDLEMGAATFGRSEAAGNAALSARGYDQEVIQDYRNRTAATIERNRQAEAQAAAMREQGRSMEDQPRQQSMMAAPAAGAATTPAPTTTPVVPGSPEDTSGPGPAEIQVAEEAKKKTGYAGTVETTPSGLMTEAKTRKKRSLMGGLLSA